MKFGAMLSMYREQCNFSVHELARMVGCDSSYISRLQAGQRMPSRRIVLRCAQALGLNTIETNSLLIAAGYAPPVLIQYGTWSQDLEDFFALLAQNRQLEAQFYARFRNPSHSHGTAHSGTCVASADAICRSR